MQRNITRNRGDRNTREGVLDRDNRIAHRDIRGINNDLYYTLTSAHIRGGPAHDVPLTLTATPNDLRGVPDYRFQQHLVQALRIGMISLVRLYARRFNTLPMSTPAIQNLPIFFFPTEVLFFFNPRFGAERRCRIVWVP